MVKKYVFRVLSKGLVYLSKKWPNSFMPPQDTDLYASGMTEGFNCIHGLIYPRFFEKIHVESEDLYQLKELSKTATLIYVTKDIGQLEYNFFNYFLLNERLPLARFVNELSLWQWLPFKKLKHIVVGRAMRFLEEGSLPHPVSSGYAKHLILDGHSILIQIKTSALFDDLYWYSSNEDPLSSVIEAHQKNQRSIYLIPLHFIWDKRPEGRHFIDLLPNTIKKNVIFWKNYKNRALVKIGEPIKLEGETSKGQLRPALISVLKQGKKVITGPPLKPKSWIINQILEDQGVQKKIYELSLEKNKSVDDLKLLAGRYANEIAADVNYSYIEIGLRIMKWVIKNIYDGVVINQEGLNSLKKAVGMAPVILVPNHKSHMDYLILSSVLYEHNITIPHVAAGINLSFWPMGHIFRRCGAFFLRRTFKGNELYRSIFKAYLKILLLEGYCQEFFIEGTRTRAGKLLRPRTGMINMLSEGIKEANIKETYFIPVAITYDQIMEEYKHELEGEQKKKERTRDLLALRKYLNRRYGKIYIRFGEPIAFSEQEGDTGKLINNIMVTINRELVVTPTAVVAAALLFSGRRGITYESLFAACKEIINFLNWKGAKFSDAIHINQDAALNDAINTFRAARHIELHKEFEPPYYEIKEDRRTILDYYKNNIIHLFVSASCLANIIHSQLEKNNPRPSPEELREPYLFCKTLFGLEFTFSTRLDIVEHISKTLSWFETEKIEHGSTRFEIYKGMLTNYFESYLTAFLACREIAPMEERTLLKRLIKYGRYLLLIGRITRNEAISNPVFKNALQFLVMQKILEVDPKKRYKTIATQDALSKLQAQLEELS